MNQFQGVDLLLELDVVGRECSLGTCQHGCLGQLTAPQPLQVLQPTLSSACPSCSLRYCELRWAKGETVELKAELVQASQVRNLCDGLRGRSSGAARDEPT